MPQDPLSFGEIAAAVVSGESNDFVRFFKTDKVTFSSKEAYAWTLDGEFGGEHKKVILENQHRSIAIMVPQDSDIPRLPETGKE